MSLNLQPIALDAIRTDGGTQSRAQLNDEVVADYATTIRSGVDFPPVTVFYDGKKYWLADGFHRVEAHKRAGAFQIAADVRQGTKRDAVLHSVGANADHGLRRSNADKRRAVETLLRDKEWAAWSDREIARRCCVGAGLVADARQSICTIRADSDQTRQVKRGETVYEQKTANIGKTGAASPLPDSRPDPETPSDPPPAAPSASPGGQAVANVVVTTTNSDPESVAVTVTGPDAPEGGSAGPAPSRSDKRDHHDNADALLEIANQAISDLTAENTDLKRQRDTFKAIADAPEPLVAALAKVQALETLQQGLDLRNHGLVEEKRQQVERANKAEKRAAKLKAEVQKLTTENTDLKAANATLEKRLAGEEF